MKVTDAMLDVVFDALAAADMEVVYVDHREHTSPIYGEAGIDAREPMTDGLRAALALTEQQNTGGA